MENLKENYIHHLPASTNNTRKEQWFHHAKACTQYGNTKKFWAFQKTTQKPQKCGTSGEVSFYGKMKKLI
jgi:hypothetical protein